MTRILVITNMYPPHHLGGYELSCRDVVERLRARGHEVAVLTTTMRLDGVDAPDAPDVHRRLEFYWRDHVIVRPSLPKRIAIERSNQAALAEALERYRPDVVSAWNMGAMSLALLSTVIERGIPLVLVVCDDWLWYAPNVDAWTRPFVGRPRLSAAARAVTGLPAAPPDLSTHGTACFVTEMIRRRALERSMWKPSVSTVVYSGIDLADFPIDPVEPERAWRWRLLYAGRLDDRKGVHVAVEALPHLPAEAKLDVVGRGDDRYLERLRSTAERLGVSGRVRFSVVDRADLAARYRDADALVFPVVWDEPFGLVPIEAMACGTPVVATATGGSAEFLIDGLNCLTVPRGDAAALATAVRELAADPALRARLRAGGSRTAAELNVDRLADTLEEWHVAAAERFARGRPADRRAPAEILAAAPDPGSS